MKSMKGASARTWLLGDFDYKFLCTPRFPFGKRAQSQAGPPFYGPYQPLGIFTAAIMGLQHALAMAGGLVTPPLLVGMMASDDYTKSYLIQVSLLVCGITTFIQVTGFKIPKTNFQLGSALLSVMGVSFASVPLFQSVIKSLMTQGDSFDVAFGKMLGTTALCAVWPIVLSFMPHRALKKVFPPIVTGVTIFLIGAKLVATGFKYWGGGVFCGENYLHMPAASMNCLIPQLNGTTITAPCYQSIQPLCTDNGDVKLPYGSAPYIGMGFLVFVTIIIIELFGSPFMRNASLVLALLFGLLVSALVKVDGNRMVNGTILAKAPAFTFLWLKRFPLGFYPAAILPLIIVFTITSVETVGDVAATAELSQVDLEGPSMVARIRGGMLNDGLSGIFSSLTGSLPLTTFAQNNGVIALTNVSSRWAGWAASGWLLLFGLVGKFGGLVLSIPHCVLGGATSFLFACVITSGIKILMMGDGFSRRNRFIVSCALAFGLGVSMVPQWSKNNLWPEPPAGSSPGYVAARLAVMLVLETGFCVGAIVAFLLNLIMPSEGAPPKADPDTSVSSSLAGDVKTIIVEKPADVTMTKDIEMPVQKC